MTKAFKIKMYICFNPAHTCVTWHIYKNILCNIVYNSGRLETRWTIISRYSCIMQPFKNEAVLYKPSRTISKIHSKVGKRCKTTQNTNSLGKIDVFSICVYKFIYDVYKKLKIIGCLWRRELHAWMMGSWNYFSLFNLLWFNSFESCACIVYFK